MGALEAYIKSGGKDVLGQKVAQDLAKKIKLLPAPSGKATFAQRKSIILPKSVTETKLGKIDIGKAKMGTTDTKPLLNSKILELPAPRLPE